MLNIVEDLDVNLDVEDLQEIKIVHMQKNIIDYTEDTWVTLEDIGDTEETEDTEELLLDIEVEHTVI